MPPISFAPNLFCPQRLRSILTLYSNNPELVYSLNLQDTANQNSSKLPLLKKDTNEQKTNISKSLSDFDNEYDDDELSILISEVKSLEKQLNSFDQIIIEQKHKSTNLKNAFNEGVKKKRYQ